MQTDYEFYPQYPARSIKFDEVLPQDTVVGFKALSPDETEDQYDVDWRKIEEIIPQLNAALAEALNGTGVRGTFHTDYYSADLILVVDETSDLQAAVSTDVLFRLHDLMLRFVPAQPVLYSDEPSFVDGKYDASDRLMLRRPDGTITVYIDSSDEEDETV